jgi:hypothetical protein
MPQNYIASVQGRQNLSYLFEGKRCDIRALYVLGRSDAPKLFVGQRFTVTASLGNAQEPSPQRIKRCLIPRFT